MRSSLIESAARRRLLAGGASALAAASLGRAALAAEQKAAPGAAAPPAPASAAKPLPPYAAWKQPDAMIVHSANTIETRREAFGSGVVTPLRQLYVRNNLPPPDEAIVADRDAWIIEIAGVA